MLEMNKGRENNQKNTINITARRIYRHFWKSKFQKKFFLNNEILLFFKLITTYIIKDNMLHFKYHKFCTKNINYVISGRKAAVTRVMPSVQIGIILFHFSPFI